MGDNNGKEFQGPNQPHPHREGPVSRVGKPLTLICKSTYFATFSRENNPVEALVTGKQVALGQYVAPGTVLASLQAVDEVEKETNA